MDPRSSPTRTVRFGVYELDLCAGELRKSGIRIRLQEQPLRVLAMLLQRPGEVVTREEFQKELWPDTFVDFEHSLNAAVKRLRETLDDPAESPRFVETVPRRGYRFIFPVASIDAKARAAPAQLPVSARNDETASESLADVLSTNQAAATRAAGRSRRLWIPAALIVATFGGTFIWLKQPLSSVRVTDKDTIVLADFTNTTGDPVFDGALRQGLSIQLEQSPFLSIISDEQIQQTLRMMDQEPVAKLTPEIARELCQRTSSAAVLDGSIAQIGTRYLLTLKAVNCASGASLASTEAQASDKNHVLDALGKTASDIRNKLGESLATVQKFDTPLPEVTTSSLEALKVYALGRKAWSEKENMGEAGRLLLHAIELDPNFALSYASLGTFLGESGYPGVGREYIKKAFALRDHVSAREKLAISAVYYMAVTGELGDALSSCRMWEQLYPRDAEARRDAGYVYIKLGQPEKGLVKFQESVALDPDNTEGIAALMGAFATINRFEEAKAVYDKSLQHQLDNGSMHLERFYIAHLENDTAEMNRQLEWPKVRPDEEDGFLGYQGAIEARRGRMRIARELERRGMEASERDSATEEAAGFPAVLAVWDADYGESELCRRSVTVALALAQTREVRLTVALALARVGDSSKAQALAKKLHAEYPSDTLINLYWLPLIRAAIELNRRNPDGAIKQLQPASPYDLAADGFEDMYIVYLRGEAFRLAHRGSEAAAEFQKVLDNRGPLAVSTIDALARLGLARAFALQSDTATARAKYQDFLTHWKDADPDIPILKEAKAEYAKLQ